MIHSELKQSTRDLHCALAGKSQVLLSADITLDKYAAVQQKFYGLYRPIEVRLLSTCISDDPELQLENRLMLSLLLDDLVALAVEPDEISRLPHCDSLPRIETLPEALGCLYVLEGSTIGGKIITGHLTRALSLGASRGCAFFNGYGDDVGRLGSSFLGGLARHCERYADEDVIVRSACQTFASLDQWFSHAA